MNQNDVSLVKNDELIMQLTDKPTSKHFHDPDKHAYVREKVRQLCRLLVVPKEVHHSLKKCAFDVK